MGGNWKWRGENRSSKEGQNVMRGSRSLGCEVASEIQSVFRVLQ